MQTFSRLTYSSLYFILLYDIWELFCDISISYEYYISGTALTKRDRDRDSALSAANGQLRAHQAIVNKEMEMHFFKFKKSTFYHPTNKIQHYRVTSDHTPGSQSSLFNTPPPKKIFIPYPLSTHIHKYSLAYSLSIVAFPFPLFFSSIFSSSDLTFNL